MSDEETSVNKQALFKDTYERYCREIDKEDNLIDQRLNWMLASQTLLFGAFGVSGKQIAGLMYWIIPIVGIGISILVRRSVQGAIDSLNQYRENGSDHPTLHLDSMFTGHCLENLVGGAESLRCKAIPLRFDQSRLSRPCTSRGYWPSDTYERYCA